MIDYKTLPEAIHTYQTKYPDDLPLKRVEEGSFWSWKVRVLLYNQKDQTWKFEETNLFQRILWKIAKYVPCFKLSYKRVDLKKIYKEVIKKGEDNRVNIDQILFKSLRVRIDEIVQKNLAAKSEPFKREQKKTIVNSKLDSHIERPNQSKLDSQTETSNQKENDLNQANAKELTEKTEKTLVLPSDYQWLAIKEAEFEKEENQEIYQSFNYETFILELGKDNGHEEYHKLKELLKLSDKDDVKLATIRFPNKSPDVILRTDEGKIRIYQSSPAMSQDLLIYQEYDTMEYAIAFYVEINEEFASKIFPLLTVREKIVLMDEKSECFINGIRYPLTEALEKEIFSKEKKEFFQKMLNQAIPLNKVEDLKIVNSLIAEELKQYNAIELRELEIVDSCFFVPGAVAVKKDQSGYHMLMNGEPYIFEPGEESQYPGLVTLRDSLPLIEREGAKLGVLKYKQFPPNLILRTKEGEIRVYQGEFATKYGLLKFREFKTMDDAIKSCIQAHNYFPILDELISLQYVIEQAREKNEDLLQQMNPLFANLIALGAGGSFEEFIPFCDKMMDPNTPFDKEEVLKQLEKLIDLESNKLKGMHE